MLSPYGVLGLQPGCNAEELKAAYKKRALETHPDKGGDVDEFRSVKVAYESLLKTVPAQPASRKQSGSPSSATSVFSPPGVPFPNAFTTAAAQAAVGVKASQASHDKVQANSRKRRRASLEETIELAFASIPRRQRTANEVPPAAPQAKPKATAPNSKTVASPKGPKPGPKPGPNPQRSQGQNGHVGALNEDASAAKLWARLLQLPLEKRAAEISALSPRVKERLETFLREKKRLRSETKTESRDSDAESDSSSGSSSSSSTSSETKLTMEAASQKAPLAQNETSFLQILRC